MKNKTLDEQLEYLKGLGLKEINKATKLATNKIDDILHKRFDKIDSVRSKGFIAMLEREYQLDLSAWLKEYALYHNKTSQPPLGESTPQSGAIADLDIKNKASKAAMKTPTKEVPTTIQSLKLPEKDTQDKSMKAPKEKGSNAFVIVLLSLIVLGCVGYFGYRVFAQHSSTMPQKPHMSAVSADKTPQIVLDSQTQNLEGATAQPSGTNAQVAQDSLKDSARDSAKAGEGSYEGIYIDFNAMPQNPQTLGSESPLQTQQETESRQNSQAQRDSAESLQAPNALPQPLQKLKIIPNSTLWVGIIDLTSQKSSQLSLKEPYEIALEKPHIFVFGHSDFESIIDNQIFPHKRKNFVRFYFDGKELKEINYSTYKQLNPHENWQ